MAARGFLLPRRNDASVTNSIICTDQGGDSLAGNVTAGIVKSNGSLYSRVYD